MAWKDRIRSASFRGVSFGVSADDKEGGRRTVVHEFPQRDDVFVEDLGQAPNRFVVQAFVVGPDYMERRDALERALAEPGPGTLVHPWYGEVTVSQFAPFKVKHTAMDGGMAVFTLSFVRDSEPASPNATVNPKIRSLDLSKLVGLLSCDVFDAAFELAGQGAWVVEEAYSSVTAAVTRVQAILGGDVNAIAATLGAVTGYDFLSWTSAGQKLWAVYQNLGAVALASGKSRADLASDWVKIASQTVLTPVPENPGSTRARIAANDQAVNAFTRHIAVVEAAANMALAVPESRTQAKELREGFMDTLDAVLMDESGEPGVDDNAPVPLPDALYVALTDVRATTLAALAVAARSAPEVVSFTPVAVLPSLVLCYRLSGGIALDSDLIARNHILHPGFVPAEELEVLRYE